MTSFAAWLDSDPTGMDHAILTFLHALAEEVGDVLTPVMASISFFGEKGITVFLFGLFCVLHRGKRDKGLGVNDSAYPLRKTGLAVWGAMGFGTVAGNFLLKNVIKRSRPMLATEEYRAFWETVGALPEHGYSFPSGHVMAAAAGVTAAWVVTKNPKYAWLWLYVVALSLSRCYLLAHYPTDVTAGMALGVLSAFLSGACVQTLYGRRDRFPRLSRYL